MAFRQPTLAPNVRQSPAPAPDAYINTSRPTTAQPLDETREWILFPETESATFTHTASTERTPRTAGLSRLSDFGSLNSAARSRQENFACQATVRSEQDDEELDSLDEGLHAFQESSIQRGSVDLHQSGSILPRHDGLGTFPASSPEVQDQIWHFERYNSRKRPFAGHHRHKSSVQRRLDVVDDEKEATHIEDEKRERIERWRLEHSKILLDEVEKQTRRRQSMADISRAAPSLMNTSSMVDSQKTISEHVDSNTSTPPCQPNSSGADVCESFLQRVTRRVIRDFIGIDEATLSIIFGEALPAEDNEESQPRRSVSQTPKAEERDNQLPWETRLLNRLARELGFLLDHMSDHPGAFSTPSLFNSSTPDYAGIPVTQPTSSRTHPSRLNSKDPLLMSPSFDFNHARSRHEPPLSPSSLAAVEADNHHASLWGIEEEPQTTALERSEREYWEQPADIKTAFRFLHSRFTSSHRPCSSSIKKTTPLNIATTSTPDSLRRAAVLLVSGNSGTAEEVGYTLAMDTPAAAVVARA
ncbi:MAG: hypothetical protein Q9164_001563 [Protoblastenia rupestris]